MNASTLPTLHELGDARHILDEWLVETEGDVTPEIGELWGHLDGQIEEKIERWALWVVNRAGDVKKLRDEENRLAAKRKVLENAIERSKAELMHRMQTIGKTKVDTLLVTVSVQANGGKPAVTTRLEPVELWALEAARPFVKREEKVVYTLDRALVLEAWDADPETVPPSITVERGFQLRIK